MRTTITLDDDLAAALKELARWIPAFPADLQIAGDLRRADGEIDMNRLNDALEHTELVRRLQP